MGTSYEIIDLGKYKVVKGLTADALGRKVAVVGVVLTGLDVSANGLNGNNGTDAVMSGVAFIPGVGWVLAAAYFVGDPIVHQVTGKRIGEHVGEATNTTTNFMSTTWQMLLSGLSNLESALGKGWTPK